jgi:hypothetical protein
MKKIVIYDSYVFSQVGIMKLLGDHLNDISFSLCTNQNDVRSITCHTNVDLVIVSVWDYQEVDEIVKAINPTVKVIIYYEYLMPVDSIDKKYNNVVKLLPKKADVSEFLENIATLITPVTCKYTPIVDLPYYREGLRKSV